MPPGFDSSRQESPLTKKGGGVCYFLGVFMVFFVGFFQVVDDVLLLFQVFCGACSGSHGVVSERFCR